MSRVLWRGPYITVRVLDSGALDINGLTLIGAADVPALAFALLEELASRGARVGLSCPICKDTGEVQASGLGYMACACPTGRMARELQAMPLQRPRATCGLCAMPLEIGCVHHPVGWDPARVPVEADALGGPAVVELPADLDGAAVLPPEQPGRSCPDPLHCSGCFRCSECSAVILFGEDACPRCSAPVVQS